MANPIKLLLAVAVENGLTLVVRYGNETDYCGTNISEAMEAIEACDEMEVHFHDDANVAQGWALIINDLDDDEKIADCSGITQFLLDNTGLAL